MTFFGRHRNIYRAFFAFMLFAAVQLAPLAGLRTGAQEQQAQRRSHRRAKQTIPEIVRETATPSLPQIVQQHPSPSVVLVTSAGDGGTVGAKAQGDSPLSVPNPPPGCTQPATVGFSNQTAQTIPAIGTIVSTINVSTPQTYLRDVDVFTNISHFFTQDLQISLTSPGGTTVTLSSSNGVGANNFAGTVWDDSADPDGIPTTSLAADNPNQVQNHPYVSGTVATPLSPEEALAAFIGENPNGTWTLRIADTFDGTATGPDGGTLNAWSLNITTLTTTPNLTTGTTVTNSTPVAISSGNPSLISSTLNMPATGSIAKVIVTTNITHSSSDDLEMALTSPAGTTVTLTNGIWDSGGFPNSQNVYAGTTWDDDADPDGTVPYASNPNNGADHPYTANVVATPLTPVEGFGAFIGQSPTGTWTLRIADQFTGDGGTLNSWSVKVITASCPSAGEVTVTGRVLTPEGRGLRYARVMATDSHGVTHSVPTGKRGIFVIPELDAGETYIFSVASRRYSYSPVVMTLTDSIEDLEFWPLSNRAGVVTTR